MPPPRRSRREPRKVQTRLSFEPKSNSPSHASSSIPLARVVYEDPRMPRKKVPSSNANEKVPSSSANINEEPTSSARSMPHFSDEDDVFADGKKFAVVLSPSSRSTSTRGRSFMGAASSSVKQKGRPKRSAVYDTDSESEAEEMSPAAEKRKIIPTTLPHWSESDEEEVAGPAEKLKEAPIVLEDDSDSDEVVATSTDRRRKRPVFLKDGSESPLRSPPRAIVKNGIVETPTKSRSRSRSESPIPKKTKTTPIRNYISGGYLNPAPTPRSATSQRDPTKNDKPVSSKLKGKEIVAISSDEDSDSDDIVIEQPSIRKRKTDSGRKEKALPTRKRRRSTSSEDDEPVRSSPTKRRKQVLHEEASSEESDSEPAVPARRLTATPRKTQPTVPAKSSSSKRSKEEPARQTRQMNTPKKHRTEKQKKLELLKRRRAGEKIDELTESSSDDQVERGAYDSDASHAALSVFDDEEANSSDAIEAVRQSLRPGNRNLDDDSFIVDDDPNQPLGEPLPEIPLEFTHHAHKHLKEHFKDAIEWMVQKKINPSFNHRDPIYIQAFRKLEPEARGLAQSKFSSAAWTPTFTRALWSRPQFHEEDIGGPGGEGEGRKCDACGRSGHPARFRVRLCGKPYFQETLEEVEDSDSEEDDEDDDKASVNSKGQKLPSADTEFYLGRFCRANAERAHALIHWKHALYEWVVQTLSDQGFLDAEKLAERIKWGTRKLGGLANDIVDEWTENGEIKGLYRDFKNNLEAARNSKQDRWNA
ncbi:hypothetical protein O988_03287 [Pseudogymnoascus sp. VKM F-3808]|nr:hypothetical protein O988_03287 [Pseudogymnoascus sp. VKM F-3808]